jgi:flagellar biosynthesis protein FliQ
MAFLVGIMLLLPWMLSKLMAYTVGIIGDLPRYAR